MGRDTRNSPEKGSAIVASVVFAVSVMALTASVISGGLALRQEAQAHDALRGAQQAAESGIHFVVAKMSRSEGPALLAAGRTEAVLRGTGRSASRYAEAATPLSGVASGGSGVTASSAACVARAHRNSPPTTLAQTTPCPNIIARIPTMSARMPIGSAAIPNRPNPSIASACTRP